MLFCILDPLFNCVSREVGYYRLKIKSLLSLATTCRAASDHHTKLMEKQRITTNGSKIGYVYNTDLKHGFEITAFNTEYKMGKIKSCELTLVIYSHGRKITRLDVYHDEYYLTISDSNCDTEFQVGKMCEGVTIDKLIHILKLIRSCNYKVISKSQYNGLYSFNTDSAEKRMKYSILDEFETSGYTYEKMVKYMSFL